MYFVFILLNKRLRISVKSLLSHVFCFHSVKQTTKNICEIMYCFVYILLNKQLRIPVKSLLSHVLFCFHCVKQTAKNICEKLVESCIVLFSLC